MDPQEDARGRQGLQIAPHRGGADPQFVSEVEDRDAVTRCQPFGDRAQSHVFHRSAPIAIL